MPGSSALPGVPDQALITLSLSFLIWRMGQSLFHCSEDMPRALLRASLSWRSGLGSGVPASKRRNLAALLGPGPLGPWAGEPGRAACLLCLWARPRSGAQAFLLPRWAFLGPRVFPVLDRLWD